MKTTHHTVRTEELPAQVVNMVENAGAREPTRSQVSVGLKCNTSRGLPVGSSSLI